MGILFPFKVPYFTITFRINSNLDFLKYLIDFYSKTYR
ncbi:hypothetical protein IGI49_001675 [Enterococcus sp. AZ071]